jgi:hypothetical protein
MFPLPAGNWPRDSFISLPWHVTLACWRRDRAVFPLHLLVGHLAPGLAILVDPGHALTRLTASSVRYP